jgi:hypothetical protein
MNIFGRVQKLISTVLCPHDEDKCDRSWQQLDETNHIESLPEDTADNFMMEPDNFLRGSLMNEQRRRHSKTMNKIAVSYWRHGAGCSCCTESHMSDDIERIAPLSKLNRATTTDVSRNGYLNLEPANLESELQCLTSFITESGRHRVITQEFADQVTQASTGEVEPITIVNNVLETQDPPRRDSSPTLQDLPAVQTNVVTIRTSDRLSKLIQK